MMPCCCVIGCHNRAEKGHKLYKLPQGGKNSSRRKQWIENIGRKDPLPIHAYVCQDHFTNDQFELTRADHKKLLKWNAVPTIFAHNNTNNNYKTLKKTVTTVLDCSDVSEKIVTDESIKIESRVKEEINLKGTKSDGDSDEVTALRNELSSCRKQIHTLKTIISQLQAIIERLVEENYIDELNDPV